MQNRLTYAKKLTGSQLGLKHRNTAEY